MATRSLPLLTALALSLACGGGSGTRTTPPPPAASLSAEAAESALTSFLNTEAAQTHANALPVQVPGGDPGVYALALPASSGCLGVATAPSSLTLTFNGCAGVNGATLSGQIQFAWQPGDYTVTYRDLQVLKGTRSWTLNGSKRILLNLQTQQAQISATALSLAFADSAAPSTRKTYTYGCALTADWATAGSYKLWGTFSYQADAEAPLAGIIPAATPLVWSGTCCYPLSGTLALTQGTASASATFGAPCGTLSLTPAGQAAVVKTLAPCP